MRWDELDRPIKYAIIGSRSVRTLQVVPVKVYSTAPNWNGATKARTLTLLAGDKTNDGVQIDYPYSEVFETEEGACREVFRRKLKGKV